MTPYEEKMRIMSQVKLEAKDIILARILKGERCVDITKNEDMFYAVNKDRVTLERFTNRDKFKQEADNVAWQRQLLHDPEYGKSKGKKMRWLGDIPADVYFSRPEFSPMLSPDERQANIRAFLNKFPKFRAGSKPV
jgi:hypothetical protein